MSLRLTAGAAVALDIARELNVLASSKLSRTSLVTGGRKGREGRAATDDDRIAEHTQLVDEAELDRCRGQASAPIETVAQAAPARRASLTIRIQRRSPEPAHRSQCTMRQDRPREWTSASCSLTRSGSTRRRAGVASRLYPGKHKMPRGVDTTASPAVPISRPVSCLSSSASWSS